MGNIFIWLVSFHIQYNVYNKENNVQTSVADPDPGKYRIRILYPQKDPCHSNFLAI